VGSAGCRRLWLGPDCSVAWYLDLADWSSLSVRLPAQTAFWSPWVRSTGVSCSALLAARVGAACFFAWDSEVVSVT
jgi:hypothetical protein